MLLIDGVKDKSANSVAKSFKRLTETPLGKKLNWGYVDDNGDMMRTVCNISDPRVILYGLYVYNEKANTHYEFRLNSLYENIEQDGIPPTQIFGLSREAMIPILLGLTANYPDFINATFTNDLDKISLKEVKTPADVLNLFKEGN
jgi:phosphoadenosine phosphosulfate reductase